MSDRDKDRYRRRSRSRSRQKQYRSKQRNQREKSRSPPRYSSYNKDQSRYNNSSSYNKDNRQKDRELKTYKQYTSSMNRDQTNSNINSSIKQKQREKQKQKSKPLQQTKTLCIQDITTNQLGQLERKLNDTSITVGTSLPDDTQLRDNMAYIRYPSVQVASAIYNFLQGYITIYSKQFKLRYYPFKKIDINISYDWYCNKCDYKNFARRGKCHRCENQRNPQCRLNYSSQFVTFPTVSTPKDKQKQEQSVNCSLMIRGQVIMEIQEELLLDIFQKFAPIKDIRMIRNKVTGGNKQFAFVEFFSPEQAAFALNKATASDFRIAGQKVTVMYSRSKQEDYDRSVPFDRDRRGPPPPKKQTKPEQFTNYYQRQRQMQIQEQKKRPLITIEQLKQKHEQQLKKNQPLQIKQMTEQQKTRKQAQLLAKQWQRQVKNQNTIFYICPLCRKKFKNEQQLGNHAKYSEMHKYRMNKLALNSLQL